MADEQVSVLKEPCATCGHSFSFHGKKAKSPCKAIGCKVGKKQWACTNFKPRTGAPKELRKVLRESLSAVA